MLDVEDVASGSYSFPVFVTQAPGSTDTLWIVEKTGLIRLVRGGAILDTPFLDARALIGSVDSLGDERGLHGLAFHPDYAANGRFFIMYTPGDGGREADLNIVAEYRRSAGNPDQADATEVARLVSQRDPEWNHNGGMVAFGPDGFLYVGMGDGGGGGDDHGPIGNGQNLDTLLAKLLRLDVDAAGAEYAAAGNPLAAMGARPQIWAYGVRNPWRFSFDRLTGDLYIGDVGQGEWEEIDIQPAGTGGQNYGWRAYEGEAVFDASLTDLVATHAAPVHVYRHGSSRETVRDGCSVTGGYVYAGSAIPELVGVYLFGDYCSGDVGAFRFCDGSVMGLGRAPGLTGAGSGLASFGQDNAGEVYVVYQNDARVVRIVAR